MLSESPQNILLQHINPWFIVFRIIWPLQVYIYELSMYLQVLLLKSRLEREAAYISIQHRLVTIMVENVCNLQTTYKAENADLNVEHAQLVPFLFHFLNLMQKKSVLLVMESGVVCCSETVKMSMKDSQLLHLSRLLLLLEYMMKHLYDAHPKLLEQIQWNLFSAISLVCDTKDGNKQTARTFTPWIKIEDNYKYDSQDKFPMKPRFYNLSRTDFNNQDAPKLDGLVCNFILAIPDKMKYPLYKNKLALDEEIPVGFILLHSLIWEPHKTLIEKNNEPILGLWFEEILISSDEISTNTNKETNNEASAGYIARVTIVPDNREPHAQMEKRPKRVTSKPSRYMTTSSDEAPKKRKKGSIITAEDIEKDAHEIRNALEEDYSSSDSSNNYPTHTPHTPTNNLSQRTHIHTDSQSHTNIQSHTNTQQLDANVSPYTSVQSYINFQPHASIQSHNSTQLNTNVSPHISVQPYLNVQPHANIQSHTNTHLDTNILPHTSVEPYINFQPYTNIQSHTSTQLNTNVSPHTSIQPNISHTVPTVSRISSVTHALPTYSLNNNTEEISSEQNISRTLSNSNRCEEIPALQSEETDNWRTRIETELKRMNKLLQNILKYMQNQMSHKQISHKPAILPISSVEEMEAFELINDDSYSDVVNYFRYIGGFNLKEAVNLCFKEGLKDTVTSSFTWWGREERQRPMYNTRFVIAIYEAICNNRYFEKPTRSEFQAQMREALRTAKERLRSKIRGPRKQPGDGINRNFWNDERNV